MRRRVCIVTPGNLAANPHVGLLFIAMHDKPKRLRVNGEARISRDDPLLKDIPGAQMIVRVTASVIFPNCARYIPSLTLAEPSVYTPQKDVARVEPSWKGSDAFKDVVPPRAPTKS